MLWLVQGTVNVAVCVHETKGFTMHSNVKGTMHRTMTVAIEAEGLTLHSVVNRTMHSTVTLAIEVENTSKSPR